VGAYKQAQIELWNAAGAATQHAHTELLRPLYDDIVSIVSRRSCGGHDAAVLDIASGPGEPALSIARALPSCSVLATDVACSMVHTARLRAELAGLRNLRCRLLLLLLTVVHARQQALALSRPTLLHQ
jgi:2-polyprenyl-3-methyl-5-hydroxy-6-metoxy-1,4-benzoquinol methylase